MWRPGSFHRVNGPPRCTRILIKIIKGWRPRMAGFRRYQRCSTESRFSRNAGWSSRSGHAALRGGNITALAIALAPRDRNEAATSSAIPEVLPNPDTLVPGRHHARAPRSARSSHVRPPQPAACPSHNRDLFPQTKFVQSSRLSLWEPRNKTEGVILSDRFSKALLRVARHKPNPESNRPRSPTRCPTPPAQTRIDTFMMPSPSIYTYSNARAFLPALSRHRPSSHRCAAFNSCHATNPVALPADRSFTPTHATFVRRKPIAATLQSNLSKPEPAAKSP